MSQILENSGLEDLEEGKNIQFKFQYKGQYCGQISAVQTISTGKVRVKAIRVNLAAMDTHTNDGRHYTSIQDDDDAIERVAYTINHEYLHLAMYRCGHNVGIEQERMIYGSIGNGGNGMVNTCYDIPVGTPTIEDMV